MDLFFEDRERQLPIEIWKIIINYCCWTDPQLPVYSVRAASRVIKRVLSRTSRWCRQLMQNLAPFMPYLQAPLYPGCDTTYCCHYNYVSLLKYAIEQGASIESTTVTEAARLGHIDCLKVLDKSGCAEYLQKRGLDEAAKYNQREVIKYYLDMNIKVDASTINNAVMSGSIELFEYLQSIRPVQDYSELGYYAARSGSLPMVKFIEQYTPLDQRCIEGSAFSGSIEVLEYLLDKGIEFESERESSNCIVTIAYGFRHKSQKFLEYVYYAVQRGAPLGDLLVVFVEQRDIESVNRLIELNAKLKWDDVAIDIAAAKGDRDMVKGLIDLSEEHSIREDSHTSVQFVAKLGNVELLKYMIEKGARCDASSFGSTTSEPMLKYLIELFRGSSELTVAAAKAINLEGLKFLGENGCPWPENIIDCALDLPWLSTDEIGAIALIKYIRQQECEWTAQASANAAKLGAIELLKYLHENGCPWDEQTTASAGNYECLLYALDNGCPINSFETMDNAAQVGSLEMLQLLHQRGVPWNHNTCTILLQRISLTQLEMLKYAHENGAPWATDTINEAIRQDSFFEESFNYAIENGCPWDPQQSLEAAMNVGDTKAVKWIQNKIRNDI